MKVAFRTDASLQIGTGHVMRCLTLAKALRARGAKCQFVCREHSGNLLDHIRQEGFEAIALPLAKDQQPCAEMDRLLTHAAWLACNWATDAAQTKLVLGREKVKWLVVDHYAIDARWEVAVAGYCYKLMVIDDLADRQHDCDLLLDQNWFGDKTPTRYLTLVPPGCRSYLGPEYALLKPDYLQLRESMPTRRGKVHRVLVFMGGSDPMNETAKALIALMHPSLAHLQVDVVLGKNHPDAEGMIKQVATRPGTTLHQELPSLAPLMAEADLMISAGGTTTWERMCLGLPAIVISVAENQNSTNQALMNAGYIQFLGEMKQVSASDILKAVQRCIDNPELIKAQSKLGQQLVRGDGVSVICQELIKS